MVLKIRLAKGGCHKSPLYQIVLAHIRSPRDRKHIEKLGYYDPLPNANGTKQIALNLERTKYWIGNNVQVSDTAHKILAKVIKLN
jgi:small subunit ribosomal protein S16